MLAARKEIYINYLYGTRFF